MQEYGTIKLPLDIISQLRQAAKENCRSMASQIAFWTKEYFNKNKEETFEEYYQRNKSYLDKVYDDAVQGKNCVSFDSWEEALDFLNTKKKECESE